MNFSTEKMAKALDLPSKLYLTELKLRHPTLYSKLQAEYDINFTKFYKDISDRIRGMLSKEINIKQFVESCKKEFEKRKEFERELTAGRKVEISSDEVVDGPSMVDSEVRGKPMKLKVVGDYVFSDDESPVPPSGTLWQAKYEALEKDFFNLNLRYQQCKSALAHQMVENAKLRAENEILRSNEIEMKKECVCRQVEEVFKKRRIE